MKTSTVITLKINSLVGAIRIRYAHLIKTYRLRAREGSLFSYYINLEYRENTEYSDGVILEVYNLCPQTQIVILQGSRTRDVNVTAYGAHKEENHPKGSSPRRWSSHVVEYNYVLIYKATLPKNNTLY
jgi:hypothetical protein